MKPHFFPFHMRLAGLESRLGWALLTLALIVCRGNAVGLNVVDFNGDGFSDFLFYNPTTGLTTIWFMSNKNYSSSKQITNTSGQPWVVTDAGSSISQIGALSQPETLTAMAIPI